MGKVVGHPWSPRSSGLLSTNRYRRTLARYELDQKRHGSDRIINEKWKYGYRMARDRDLIPTFREEIQDCYSYWELERMADVIIYEDPGWIADGSILNEDMYKRRSKREIYNTRGVPDPSIASGLYWRTHPQGRKLAPDERRKKGESFYLD